ncbi:hypothetical protein F5Y14DRAFT_338919 [Nemania sp. NC0429]|nr:hypothetical protein F5Y14DRAFT_338919 [Nemania sp. NC0429]
MASGMVSFPYFSKLPPELRDQIWGYAFPEARIYEVLDSPSSTPSQAGPSAKLMFADVRNEPPPVLARVCRDSRQAVLRHYKPLAFSGVVKHINLRRDILLLDSYLQVRRLLKVVRLLSQIESVRRLVSRIALGTSWGLHTGLYLRIFQKPAQTQQNMKRLLVFLSKFTNLDALILVVFQRSAFNLIVGESDPVMIPWDHHDLHEVYHYALDANFNMDNYWQSRPQQAKLVQFDPEAQKTEKPSSAAAATAATRASSKSGHSNPQPQGHHVRDLKRTFEKALRMAAVGGLCEPPKLETATLTWIYTGYGRENHHGQ